MDNQVEFQQEQFINLGKQLQEKETREERFNENLKTLEKDFDKGYKDIKIKKDDIFTIGVNEILDKLYEKYEMDCDETQLVLYVKFLKYIIKQKDNELKRDKESIEDLNEMSSSYLEEISELEEKETRKQAEYEFYITMSYLVSTFCIYFLVNFLALYFVGRTSYDSFWISSYTITSNMFYNCSMIIIYILKGVGNLIYSHMK